MACIPDFIFKNHLIEKDMPEEIVKIIKEITEDKDGKERCR